jgi:hypothetical protein
MNGDDKLLHLTTCLFATAIRPGPFKYKYNERRTTHAILTKGKRGRLGWDSVRFQKLGRFDW